MAAIEALPKDTPLAFYCHHGGRSRGAAEHFLKLGFKNVYNLAGGIDAWSRDVDPERPALLAPRLPAPTCASGPHTSGRWEGSRALSSGARTEEAHG